MTVFLPQFPPFFLFHPVFLLLFFLLIFHPFFFVRSFLCFVGGIYVFMAIHGFYVVGGFVFCFLVFFLSTTHFGQFLFSSLKTLTINPHTHTHTPTHLTNHYSSHANFLPLFLLLLFGIQRNLSWNHTNKTQSHP